MAISPDGNNIYAIGNVVNAVGWYSKNLVTGDISYIDKDETADLDHPTSVVVSPDDKHVYVTAATTNNSIAWYERAIPGNGALTYIGRYNDLSIDTPMCVSVSSDGKNVYVAVGNANAVAWFTRDSSTGALTYINRIVSANLNKTRSAAVSPDNKDVYLAAEDSDSVVWFTRDTDASGDLSNEGVYSNPSTIDGASSVAISSGGNHVYVASAAIKTWKLKHKKE